METNDVLIPLAKADALGLGVGRRTLGRKIKDPNSGFPPTIRINGRLYVRGNDLAEYKAKLIREGLSASKEKTASANSNCEAA